jgi:peptidoglycan/LPS O-acetylase OafA/YrhL
VLYLKSAMTQWEEWAVCLLLGLAIPLFATIRSTWVNAATETIAKYSYGIYLTHFFVIWLAFEKFSSAAVWWKISLFVTLAVALPVIFYHLVEEPMIQLGKRVAQTYVADRDRRDSRQCEAPEAQPVEVAAV